jgi:hypothetical protein
MQPKTHTTVRVVAAALVATLAVSPRAFGEDQMRAVITARGNDGTVTVQADDLSTDDGGPERDDQDPED